MLLFEHKMENQKMEIGTRQPWCVNGSFTQAAIQEPVPDRKNQPRHVREHSRG
jgi:hypothetical protein